MPNKSQLVSFHHVHRKSLWRHLFKDLLVCRLWHVAHAAVSVVARRGACHVARAERVSGVNDIVDIVAVCCAGAAFTTCLTQYQSISQSINQTRPDDTQCLGPQRSNCLLICSAHMTILQEPMSAEQINKQKPSSTPHRRRRPWIYCSQSTWTCCWPQVRSQNLRSHVWPVSPSVFLRSDAIF